MAVAAQHLAGLDGGRLFVIASGVELTQGLLLTDRTASYEDIVANTLGALLGAALVAVVRRLDRRFQVG